MMIYDALLADKRVLFSGSLEQSAQEIGDYVLTSSLLLLGLPMGISLRLYPYAALDNLSFLDDQGFLAGVTNPMFKSKSDWHDLCCEVDLGKIRVARAHYNYFEEGGCAEADAEFVRPIIQRLKSGGGIEEETIRRAFDGYTRRMVEMAAQMEESGSGGGVYTERLKRLVKTNMYKIYKAMARVKEADMKNNISTWQLEVMLRKLRLSQAITDPEAQTIFSQLLKYL